MSMKRMLVAVLGLLATHLLAAATRDAHDPLYVYYWNSLVCQNQVTKAVCHLWLNPDGRYLLVYDLGVQDRPLEIDGPYRIEGRDGSYKLKGRPGSYQVCITPDKPPKGKVYVSEQRKELFAVAGCYEIVQRSVGDIWMQNNTAGQVNKLWLLANR
ncbi:MAG: hypothetical protein QM808_13920 [Steroidobacteraceae bacterium]